MTAVISHCLLIFSRYPQAGKTKTRLIPALGPEGAAQLQRQMSEHTLAQARLLRAQLPVTLTVCFTGSDRQTMQAWLGSDLAYYPQQGVDLGERLTTAFAQAFAAGHQGVIAIGIDCPDLSAGHLAQAFAALDTAELVLGPAADGGYYLIGLTRLIPELFANIPWGNDQVFRQTQAISDRLGLRCQYLPQLRDVDRPEDLPLWQAHQPR